MTTETESTFDNIRATVTDRFGGVRETATAATSAVTEAGKAYFNGLGTIGQTLMGFGREAYGDVVSHVQESFRAKDMRAAAELQAAFVQNRIEKSAAHTKEFVDVTRQEAEKSLRPLIDLFDKKSEQAA